MNDPSCERCIVGKVYWLHDKDSHIHQWQLHESSCVCMPEPVCAICDFSHLNDKALLLGKRITAISSIQTYNVIN